MKKIFTIMMTALMLGAVATSCLKEGKSLASSITADKTELLPFEAAGSEDQFIKVTADGEWVAGAPSWVVLSKYTGSGNTELKVSVKDNYDAEDAMQAPRSGVITIGGSNGSCVVSVRQRGDKGKLLVIFETVTVKQFLDKAEDKDVFYHLQGTISSTYNNFETYGNFYLKDAAGDSILVYGLTKTKLASNDKSFASLGLKVGDAVSLAGYRTSYSGTAQVGGGYVYDPEKQNVQISPEKFEAEVDTADFVLDIVSRGTYTVASAVDWIICEAPDVDHQVKVHVKKNTVPAPREGKITVTATVGETVQSVECVVSQKFNEPETITTVAQAKAAPLKSTFRIHGQVLMAAGGTSKGYIINDGTGNLLVYATSSYAAGDSVKVIGQTSVYNYGFQIGTQYFSEKLGRAQTVINTLPVQVDSLALVAKTTLASSDVLPCELVEIVATVYKSGNYAAAKALAGKKAVNYTASLFTPKGMNLLTDTYLDKEVKLTGYFTAYKSSSKQLTLYLTKAEPVTVR